MARKKKKKKKVQHSGRRKATRQSRRQTRKPVRRAPDQVGTSLALPRPDSSLEPIHLNRQAEVISDPRALLDLSSDAPASVRAAYRSRLLECPPEADPERARLLREARDRLLSADRVIERLLGEVRVPDPAAWKLTRDESEPAEGVESHARLVAQALLYALLEDEMISPSQPQQTPLFPLPATP